MSGDSTRARQHRRRLGASRFDELVSRTHWTTDDCAAYLGIAARTWTAYVARTAAPDPEPGWDPATGRRVWARSAVVSWDEARPGRAGRPRRTTQATATK